MRKIFIKFIIAILFIVSFITILELLENNTYAASISSDINGIDEAKYPGVKQLLEDIKTRHPNWKINVYYTGLDWDSVIEAENEGHLKSPVSLIYDTYSIGWICPICGYTKYDVSKRYYCASKEAIEYMMDPRNSLTDEYIFQFQDLSSSEGERASIEKMVQGTFLNKTSYIDAIMEAAQTEGISPFHLVSRIKQEQGSAGIGTMNGYVYQTEDGQSVVVYNLFNINVSGNDSQAGFLAGAKFAYEQGWTTAEASIKGGAKFLKNEYLNVGQTTLYFQKFDVIETGGLYNNQYMQNIRAANDEGNSMYQTYVDNEILNSTFEFTIPLYENMPKEACKRPVDNYYGTINTEFINMNWTLSNGVNYLQGEIYIAEWVDGNCWTPNQTPKMTLKSTDGKVQYDMYVSYLDGIRYYFDRDIEKIDTSKEYYIEVELQGSRNMASTDEKTQKVVLPDKIIKEGFKNKTIKTVNNKIVFSDGEYKGTINTELKSTKLIQNSNGEYYISGYVDIGEYINGKCNTPKSMPEIWLKSTDGSFEQVVYVGYENGLEYYFDKMIQYLDMSKEYYLEAVLTTEENIASLAEKSQKLKLGNTTIGEFDNITVIAKNNNFVMNYKGTINTELDSISLIQNSAGDNYISGYIYIAEWINGECKTPFEIPEIRIKSTDGTFETTAYVGYEEGIKYYFDKCITDFDVQKEYIIEAYLVTKNNIGTEEEKTQEVKITNRTIGKQGTVTVTAKNNIIKISDSSLYKGTINTELYDMEIIQNSAGDNYISGYIYIAEWVNGNCNTPKELPKMTLKSEDGSFATNMYVAYKNGIEYYFDKNIEGLDTNKTYYIEVELQGKKNVASKEEKTQTAKITKQGQVGICTNGNKVIVNEDKIIITPNLYYGTINTELYDMKIIQNSAGDNYISGYIYIAEWVDGNCNTPKELPKMTLKSEDGSFATNMYVGYQSGIEYYFDKNIEGLDTNKTYYIEVELQGENNIAKEEEKTQTAKITKQGQVGICTNGNKVTVSGNSIKIGNSTTYYGTINTELYDMEIIQNSAGDNYISGYIYIAEWVNGNCNTPKELPKMTLKSEDGSFETNMYVGYQSGIEYYFDKNIEGLDTNKTYYIEVELQGKSNTASKEEKTQTAKITKQGQVGVCTNGNKVTVSGNSIKIEKIANAKKQENLVVLPEDNEKESVKSDNKIEDNQNSIMVDNTTNKEDVQKTETKEEKENNKEDEEKNQNVIENTNNIHENVGVSNTIKQQNIEE